jgi:S1-C subfamily serine protease
MGFLKDKVLSICTMLILGGVLVGLMAHIVTPHTKEYHEVVEVIKLDVNHGIADQVEAVRDTVVHIARVGEWQGSGCIISEDGLIFTAKHVSGSSWGDFEVTLDDGTKYPVKHIIEDRENDVAFMQLDLPAGTKLPFAKLAPEDQMRVGDPLFIMGSPLGFNNFNSVSLGILSGVDRELYERAGWERYQEFDWHVMLQSTSPAFPGNSGGPVFNMRGEVIGVLVAGEAETLNFSVPVWRFRGMIETIKAMFLMDRFDVVREEEPEENYQEDWYSVGGRDED